MSDAPVVGVSSSARACTAPTTDEAEIFCEIMPEPSDDELAAVVAALSLVARAEAQDDHGHTEAPSRWATAGRHAALRGLASRAWRDWGKRRSA